MLPIVRAILNPASFPRLKFGQATATQMQAKRRVVVPVVVQVPPTPGPVTPTP